MKSMKSIMVTGGCGMIGSNLVKRLVKEGWDVYVADNLWRGKLEYLNDENDCVCYFNLISIFYVYRWNFKRSIAFYRSDS